MNMMIRRLSLAFAVFLLATLHGHAVLKERDLNNTLSVLCTELTRTHQEELNRMRRFNEMNKMFERAMVDVISRSQQIELMLYSQKSDYVFDITYACSEATELYTTMERRVRPFETFADKYNGQVKQYVRLEKALADIPDFLLTDSVMRVNRDSCMSLARAIATDMAVHQIKLERTQKRAQFVLGKAKTLNDFALEAYDRVRRNIFINGDQSFVSMLMNLPRYTRQAQADIREKYRPTDETRSEWRGNLIRFLFVFIGIYVLISSLISTVVIRFMLPKRFVTDEFKKKRMVTIICASATLFAIATLVISNTMRHYYFMIMATRLLSEYAWLLVTIMLSLLIRLDGKRVNKALALYVPITVVGFVVFIYRITFAPNTVVNLSFPVVMLLCTVWQYLVMHRYNRLMPRSDRFYTWISLLVMVVSLVIAWDGYMLMSVQLLIWWIIQLTAIQTITVIYDLLHRYEDKHIDKDADVRQTWFYDAVYKMVIPIAATFSVAGSIYWAARVFDLTEWCHMVFVTKYVNIPDVIIISLDRLLYVIALGFVFNYIIYLCVQGYILWNEYKTRSRTKTVSLSINILKYLGWGIYLYIVLVTLHVNRAGITLILTGLSTGIGFAMKDTLENLFYGLSLMSGRVKIGDIIECDGIRGKVDNINYQSTMVETIDGSVIAFLNSQLFSNNFKNLTRNHGYEKAVITVGVAYGSHIDQVRTIITERLQVLDFYDKKKGVQVLFENFGDSSVDLVVVVWLKVSTIIADTARVKEQIYNALNDNGIEIPFPQCDVNFRNKLQLTRENA